MQSSEPSLIHGMIRTWSPFLILLVPEVTTRSPTLTPLLHGDHVAVGVAQRDVLRVHFYRVARALGDEDGKAVLVGMAAHYRRDRTRPSLRPAGRGADGDGGDHSRLQQVLRIVDAHLDRVHAALGIGARPRSRSRGRRRPLGKASVVTVCGLPSLMRADRGVGNAEDCFHRSGVGQSEAVGRRTDQGSHIHIALEHPGVEWRAQFAIAESELGFGDRAFALSTAACVLCSCARVSSKSGCVAAPAL